MFVFTIKGVKEGVRRAAHAKPLQNMGDIKIFCVCDIHKPVIFVMFTAVCHTTE